MTERIFRAADHRDGDRGSDDANPEEWERRKLTAGVEENEIYCGRERE